MTSNINRACKGFTLVEMLCAIVVVLLLAGLLTTGVKLAVDSYATEVSHSESKTLCSTLRTLVSDELRYSGTVNVSGSQIAFFSQNYGENVTFESDEDGHVLLGGNKILSNSSYSNGLKAQVTLKSYDTTTRVFSVEIVVSDSSGNAMSESQFEVKQLNEKSET